MLLVRGAGVAHVVELGRGREHRATKPHGEALRVVRVRLRGRARARGRAGIRVRDRVRDRARARARARADLHVVRDDVDLDGHGLELASAQPLAVVDALVDHALDVALPPSGWGLGLALEP